MVPAVLTGVNKTIADVLKVIVNNVKGTLIVHICFMRKYGMRKFSLVSTCLHIDWLKNGQIFKAK